MNYIKSLCEVVSLSGKDKKISQSQDQALLGNQALLTNPDRDKIRELTMDQFKVEVNIMVKRINEAISSNLGGVKNLTLQKVQRVVGLIQRVVWRHPAQSRRQSSLLEQNHSLLHQVFQESFRKRR